MACRTITLAGFLVLFLFGSFSLDVYAGGSKYELKVTESYQFYDIHAQTLDDLLKGISMNGTRWEDGNVYSGVTSWDIKYVYDISEEGGEYSVPSAVTRVDIVYRLPRVVPALADPELAQRWATYMERVRHHEFGHKALAVNAAAEVNEILASLPGFASRKLLAEEVRRRTEESFRKLKEIQVAYDHETRHGEMQGAFLVDGPRLASSK